MKFILLSLCFISTTYAYTISAQKDERYYDNKVDVVVSKASCSEINLSSSDIYKKVFQSLNRYWASERGVDATSFRFKLRGMTELDLSHEKTLIKGIEKVEFGQIAIGCNTEYYLFPYNPGLGMSSYFQCNKEDCRGAILINANSDSMVKDYSDNQFLGYLGRSLGEAIGIAGSRKRDALMYYYIFRVYNEELHNDDLAAINFLYPTKNANYL